MDVQDFRQDLLNRAAARASLDGLFSSDAFMEEVGDLLIDAGEVDSLDRHSFKGLGRRRQSLAVHGFAHDEQDGSVALVVLEYTGREHVSSLSQTEATGALRALEQFLAESLSGDFVLDREPAAAEYQLSQLLKELHDQGKRRPEAAVTRYRLYLVTDAVLSNRAKSIDSGEIDGVPLEFHVWDMSRFLQLHESGQTREPLELSLDEWGADCLPALKVGDEVDDVTTYLAAVPGDLLAALYSRHGSRLLEGNVRSFLTIRGKINKGIRETVMKDPAHFLAYNNGISATASGVEYREGAISKITDLQIVNGGQTTASLFYAAQANRDAPLSKVFVQMKLVVVSPDDAVEMVPRISRYANSQNAVREDDFFSNHPFHVRMEELSKKVLAPARPGVNYQSKWYYERTRGQYLNERNRRSAAEQRKFEAEFPRNQVITKTDAAKYVVAWAQLPHQVSAGAQKNFKSFAALVAGSYEKQSSAFEEQYFRRMVAKAILFNTVRSAISKADWYQSGYLANLTAYAIAKLSKEMAGDPRCSSFDLLRIWEAQAVGPAMLAEAVSMAEVALDVLTGETRLVTNVTEWAKREAAWKQLAFRRCELSEDLVAECIPVRRTGTGEVAITVNGRFDPTFEAWLHVDEIDEPVWRDIKRFLTERSLATNIDLRQLGLVTPARRGAINEPDARALLGLYVKALNNGWVETPEAV